MTCICVLLFFGRLKNPVDVLAPRVAVGRIYEFLFITLKFELACIGSVVAKIFPVCDLMPGMGI